MVSYVKHKGTFIGFGSATAWFGVLDICIPLAGHLSGRWLSYTLFTFMELSFFLDIKHLEVSMLIQKQSS